MALRFFVGAIVGAVAAVLVLQMGLRPAKAHPMPDSEIVVARGAERVNFTIRVPMDDLLLAMKDDPAAKGLPRDAGALLAGDQTGLKNYVAGHVALEADGKRFRLVIDSLREVADEDEDVGHYSEAEMKAHGVVAGDVPLVLVYDLVLGRIANHRALVSDAGGKSLGVIRYSLADKKAETLGLPLYAGPKAAKKAGAAPAAPPAAPAQAESERKGLRWGLPLWGVAIVLIIALAARRRKRRQEESGQ